MSNIWEDEAVVETPLEEYPDSRPVPVRSQDAAILEYAVRNRLLRGKGTPDEGVAVAGAPEPPGNGRMRRPRRRGAREAARAEGLYHRIAPAWQRYPLRAVTLVRELLQEGAPEGFVMGKYRMHVEACAYFGVPPMPLIPYLEELLEVVVLDAKAARRNEAVPEHSIP